MRTRTQSRMTKQFSAIMHKVLALHPDTDVQMGWGWVLYRHDGKVFGPELYNESGEELPNGMYTLVHTDVNHLVVIPKVMKH